MAEKTRLTNAGKKEERQAEQKVDQAVRHGTFEVDGAARDVETRMAPKGHSTKDSVKGGK